MDFEGKMQILIREVIFEQILLLNDYFLQMAIELFAGTIAC